MRRHLLTLLITAALTLAACIQPVRGAGSTEVEEKLKALATEQVKAACAECKIKVECKWISPAIAKRPPSSITVLQFDKLGLPAGYVTAKVGLEGKGFTSGKAVQFYISVQQRLPVAAKNIEGGAVVTDSDLSWQWKDVSRMRRQPLSSTDVFKSKTTARMIRKGRVFYPADLLSATSIKPGDAVAMQYDKDSVTIAINCVAREAKAVGQSIRLYSKETGQHYIAKIISETKIVWEQTL